MARLGRVRTKGLLMIAVASLLLVTASGAAPGLDGPATTLGQTATDAAGGPSHNGLTSVAADQLALARSLVEESGADPLDVAAAAVTARMGLVGGLLPHEAAAPLGHQLDNLQLARRTLGLLAADAKPLSVAGSLAALSATVDAGGAADVAGTTGTADAADAIPVTTAASSPSSALTALAAHHGVALTDEQRASMAALDELADPVAEALTDLVVAFAAYDRAVDRAFGQADTGALAAAQHELLGSDLDDATVAPPTSLDGMGVALGPIVAAQAAMVDRAAALSEALDRSPFAPGTAASVPGLFVIDLDTADNTYTTDIQLLVDAGGDDAYHNNAGGSNQQAGSCEPQDRPYTAALVDLSGNDAYGDPVAPRSCGANGGGWGGAGLLVDAAGDDTYVAGDFGTNGGGATGTGLVVDAGGHDTYTAGGGGTNGGAHTAAGTLIDLAGNDAYQATSTGSNGGAVSGSGRLVDASGDDQYLASSLATNGGGTQNGHGFLLDGQGTDLYQAAHRGTNGAAHGLAGAGFLFDGGGSDTYNGGERGVNGGGYTIAAVGMLVDVSGDDTYTAGNRGTNGGGHGLVGGVGFLVDGTGNDQYFAGHSGTNGGARQLSVGFLFDGSGDDLYFPDSDEGPPAHPRFDGSFGTNGGGYFGGVAALVDVSGDDTYIAGHMGVNGGAWRSCLALALCSDSVGLLLDGSGTDTYDDDQGGSGTDRTVLMKGTLGTQVDVPIPST